MAKKNIYPCLRERAGIPGENVTISCGISIKDFKQSLLKYFSTEAANIKLLDIFDEESAFSFSAMGVKTNTGGWIVRMISTRNHLLYLIPADTNYLVVKSEAARLYLNDEEFLSLSLTNGELTISGHYRDFETDLGEKNVIPKEIGD